MAKQEICVGNKVRSGDDPESATGVVKKIVSTTKVEVSWDYGSTDIVFVDDIELHDSSTLEERFQKLFEKVHPQIQAKLTDAATLINQAVELAEEHGIPFCPDENIMWCAPSYIPNSFKKKFPGLDPEFWCDLTSAGGDERYGGWQQSQTC